jgi:hypothetical protein
MRVTYAGAWHHRDKTPVDELGPDEARGLHDRGEPYTVLVGENGRPNALIHTWLANEFVDVEFLDEQFRVMTSFTFSPIGLNLFRDPNPRSKKRPRVRAPDGLYFLKTIVHTDEYDGDTNKPFMATSYDYEQSGLLRATREWFPSRDFAEFETQVDVRAHWEPGPPAFGAYDGYLVYERWTPPGWDH